MSAINTKLALSGGGQGNEDPGLIQDVETRKTLNKTKEDIKKTNTLIWISIGIASLCLILIIVAWVTLSG